MSTMSNSDNAASSGTTSKAKKKKSKKKWEGGKAASNGETLAINGIAGAHGEVDDGEDAPAPAVNDASSNTQEESNTSTSPSQINGVKGYDKDGQHQGSQQKEEEEEESPSSPGHYSRDNNMEAKFDALAKERDNLRQEVTELRKSLEDIRVKHEKGIAELQDQLDESISDKEQAESQYQDLLSRVNTIRSQLGERLKADADELSQARAQIEALEAQNRELQGTNSSLEESLTHLTSQNEIQVQEIDELRGRASVSQENWVKERDEFIRREAYVREEYETTKQAMQDWEVLAMEERSMRENISETVADLEAQLSAQKDAYEKASVDKENQSQTINGLQRALRDIQEARKKELRELVESSQSQLEESRKQLQAAEETLSAAKSELETTRKELDRALPFEKEVKEKNLLIGKLRHEGVILNDHLTKALRFIKQKNPEDMVDRQIVTNHFLHFLTLDRSDPRKFQVLQIIAALLAWNDDQKEQSGLSRPGATNNIAVLRTPISPFRRTPSTPSLGIDPLVMDGRGSKESLADLWSDFLEREAQDGSSERSSIAGVSDRQGSGA